jgi:membrane protease YdiL (CAAX protease family)
MIGQRDTVVLLLIMLAWVVAGFAGAAISAGLVAAGAVLLRGVPGLAAIRFPGQLVIVLIAASGFQGTLLLGALWQGRRAGRGNWRAGLGLMPIRNVGPILLSCAAMIAWLIGFIALAATFPALEEFARSVTPDILAELERGGPEILVFKVALVAVLAPVSEELFFRGWLWEALSRRGHAVVTTSSMTAIPWLLLHGIDSPGRILFLIPAALIFSIARYKGGSVFASLAVHLTNNVAAVSMPLIGRLLGGG